MQGKSILITGSTGGIGGAIARQFAKEGNHLILQGRNRQRLEELCRELIPLGCTVQLWEHDFVQLFPEDVPHFGHVDIYIHGSGHSLYKMLIDTRDEEWIHLFNVHVNSAFYICKKILPSMVQRKWGRIIFISSIWGDAGAACEVAYSAAKGAMNGFAKALAKELAPSGITVNAIAPGAIDTPMVTQQFTHEEVEYLKEQIPSGRLGTPAEVAALTEFLTRDESAYITGQIIHINGGWR